MFFNTNRTDSAKVYVQSLTSSSAAKLAYYESILGYTHSQIPYVLKRLRTCTKGGSGEPVLLCFRVHLLLLLLMPIWACGPCSTDADSHQACSRDPGQQTQACCWNPYYMTDAICPHTDTAGNCGYRPEKQVYIHHANIASKSSNVTYSTGTQYSVSQDSLYKAQEYHKPAPPRGTPSVTAMLLNQSIQQTARAESRNHHSADPSLRRDRRFICSTASSSAMNRASGPMTQAPTTAPAAGDQRNKHCRACTIADSSHDSSCDEHIDNGLDYTYPDNASHVHSQHLTNHCSRAPCLLRYQCKPTAPYECAQNLCEASSSHQPASVRVLATSSRTPCPAPEQLGTAHYQPSSSPTDINLVVASAPSCCSTTESRVGHLTNQTRHAQPTPAVSKQHVTKCCSIRHLHTTRGRAGSTRANPLAPPKAEMAGRRMQDAGTGNAKPSARLRHKAPHPHMWLTLALCAYLLTQALNEWHCISLSYCELNASACTIDTTNGRTTTPRNKVVKRRYALACRWAANHRCKVPLRLGATSHSWHIRMPAAIQWTRAKRCVNSHKPVTGTGKQSSCNAKQRVHVKAMQLDSSLPAPYREPPVGVAPMARLEQCLMRAVPAQLGIIWKSFIPCSPSRHQN